MLRGSRRMYAETAARRVNHPWGLVISKSPATCEECSRRNPPLRTIVEGRLGKFPSGTGKRWNLTLNVLVRLRLPPPRALPIKTVVAIASHTLQFARTKSGRCCVMPCHAVCRFRVASGLAMPYRAGRCPCLRRRKMRVVPTTSGSVFFFDLIQVFTFILLLICGVLCIEKVLLPLGLHTLV